MERSWYSIEVSVGWVIVILICAGLASWFLYAQKDQPWKRNTRFFLWFLRFAALGLTAMLLLNPLLNHSQNSVEQPKVILAFDDSRSVSSRMTGAQIDSLKAFIRQTASDLEEEEFEVIFEPLGESTLDSIDFSAEATNLSGLLRQIRETYDDLNVGAVCLISDGIVNQGALPHHQTFPFPVYALGLGDTIPSVDVSVQSVRHNKIVFQGNRFPVQVEVFQNGFTGEQVAVQISEGGKVIGSQVMTLEKSLNVTDFNLEASSPGLKRFVVSVTKNVSEISLDNNEQEFYIEVIEGKERILILAEAPHPDVSAIRAVLNGSENYETVVFIPGVSKEPEQKDFNVVVEHGAFSGRAFPAYPNAARWYILGSRTRFDLAEKALPFFKFKPLGQQTDQVKPALNRNFSKFKLKDEFVSHLKDYPPVQVPFGEYLLSGPTESLLQQQVGSVDSGKPLMAFFDDGTSKIVLTMGSGLWMWRLQEGALHDSSPLLDELVLKTIQFLSVRTTKKRFVATPTQSQFNENEPVRIDTEVYDVVFERTYGNTLSLELTDEAGLKTDFEITDSPSFNTFQLGTLGAGVYTYTASVTSAGQRLTERGSFVVKKSQLEGVELTANHQMLRQLATTTGGRFYSFTNRDEFSEDLKTSAFKSIIHTQERLLPALKLTWLLALIFALLGTEWFLRKYLGAY